MAQYEMKPSVTEQPTVMAVPVGLHPSLVYLMQLDKLVILKTKQLQYRILNAADQQLFEVSGDFNFTCQCCCTPPPDFLWHMLDMNYQEVCLFRLRYNGCAGIPSAHITECPPGAPVGYTQFEYGCCSGKYAVCDKDNREIFSIDQPQIYSRKMDIPVLNTSGQAVANINSQVSQWSRYVVLTLSFPVNLEIGMKLNLLGAVFMMDRTMFNKNR